MRASRIDELDYEYGKVGVSMVTLDEIRTEVDADTSSLRSQYYVVIRKRRHEAPLAYQRLQHRMAKALPHEYDRAIIDLKLMYGSPADNDDCVGIQGGVGYLADADLMVRLAARLESEPPADRLIHLFSYPPPRSALEFAQSGADFMARTSHFWWGASVGQKSRRGSFCGRSEGPGPFWSDRRSRQWTLDAPVRWVHAACS